MCVCMHMHMHMCMLYMLLHMLLCISYTPPLDSEELEQTRHVKSHTGQRR